MKLPKITKEYFDEHVAMAIETEDDCGYREWITVVGAKECKAEMDRISSTDGLGLSDEDYCPTQPDPLVRDFLNVVFYNFSNNPKMRSWGLSKVMDFAFEQAKKMEA